MSESMTSQQFLDLQGQPKPKNPKQVLKGKKSQNDGKAFEHWIDQANARYAELGMALIEKLPVETNPMPPTWLAGAHKKMSGICRILSKRAPFDYYGTIGLIGARPHSTRGRAIAMECKATAKQATRIRIGPKAPLKDHQLLACDRAWRDFGTISVIVWKNGDERGILLPDRVLEAAQRYRIGSFKSIPWDWFVSYPVRQVQHGIAIDDWLSPVASFINLHLEAADAHARNTHRKAREH